MNSQQPKSRFRLAPPSPPKLRMPWNISSLIMTVVAVALILIGVLSADNVSFKTVDYLAFTGNNETGLLEQKVTLLNF